MSLLDQFLDAGKETTEPVTSIYGVPVTDQDIGNLAAMFEHPGYAIYQRLLQAHKNASVADTMGSAQETSQTQYNVGKGIFTLADELLKYPEMVRQALEAIQRFEKMRKKA